MTYEQLVAIKIHSRYNEEPTAIKLPELNDDIKADSKNSPCLFVSSEERQVFQFSKLEDKIIHKIWIHTTSNQI